MRVVLKEHTADQLAAALGDVIRGRARVARQLQAAVLKRGAPGVPAELRGVARDVMARLAEVCVVPRLELVDRVVSPTDGFARYVFRGDGEGTFEAVRIPLVHRAGDEKYVVCVSSQVGCAMRCGFCATGRMGFRRNLAAWEIVDQVLQVRADSPHPVRGVVFMGMGEPMLNYDRVMRAAEVLTDPSATAIDAKSISVSTVGIVPAIRRFTAEGRPYRLVVSLTAATPEKRRAVLPVEDTHSLESLVAAVRDYHAASGRRVIFAWTAIRGFNMGTEDARALAELTAGLPIRLDLIDVNDTTGEYFPPSDEERAAFRDELTRLLGAPIARRYSGGKDIRAACGMLATL